VLHEERNVARALAERRDADGEDIQSVEQVSPKPPGANFGLEVTVRRRDEAYVDTHLLRATEALELLLLQHAQQLDLRVERELAHFVHEERALVGELEATDPPLQRANWAATLLEIRYGRPEDRDPVSLTTAFAGIAETGTLMLLSSPETPTTLAFLPETSIIVLPTVRVLRAYEDGFRALREERGAMPRSVNLITGPSRSGDIEQTIQLGAHGPRRLLVLLVDELPDGSPPPDA
jgi:hypothetical protein